MSVESDSVRSIIVRFYASWGRYRRLRADVKRAACRIIDCRTSRLGAHLERCDCGHICNIKYNSCRHRSCPQCQGGKRAEWLQRITSQPLPCEHAHLIFTVPEQLNVFWQFNRTTFANLLMKAARRTIETLLADPDHLGAKPGIISVLHTWGRNLSVHPHVHCLVTAGGVDAAGRFVTPQKSILLPGRVLKTMFRGKLIDYLKRAVRSEQLVVPPRLTLAKCISLFNRLARSDWNTRIQETYAHGCSVAGYLAKYVCGSPISGRRIEHIEQNEVAFWYRDHRDGQQKLMRVTPHEFLQRWSEHVPPRGLRMVRHSGLYANCCAAQRQAVCEQISQTEASTEPKQAASGITTLDPESCPLCNTAVSTRAVCRPLARVFTGLQTTAPLTRPP